MHRRSYSIQLDDVAPLAGWRDHKHLPVGNDILLAAGVRACFCWLARDAARARGRACARRAAGCLAPAACRSDDMAAGDACGTDMAANLYTHAPFTTYLRVSNTWRLQQAAAWPGRFLPSLLLPETSYFLLPSGSCDSDFKTVFVVWYCL